MRREMSDDSCLIFFRDERHDLASAAKALSERGLAVVRKADELEVAVPEAPALRIALATGDHVREEAAEISEGTDFSGDMAACHLRFEIFIKDLDATLDEANTLIEVQATLQDLTHGYLFLTWNGNIVEP